MKEILRSLGQDFTVEKMIRSQDRVIKSADLSQFPGTGLSRHSGCACCRRELQRSVVAPKEMIAITSSKNPQPPFPLCNGKGRESQGINCVCCPFIFVFFCTKPH